MSLPPELLKKVKLLEINTRKLVNTIFAGEYHAAFKGQGMTFAEFREYVPGDDVRDISWSLTAKTGKPFIKKYDEERELVILLVVDISGSAEYGSGENLKAEVITQLAALIGFSAIKNNDQVGLLLFTDQVEHFVPPRKGRGHVHRILRDILYFKPQKRGTRLEVINEQLMGILKKKSSIFIFSDFMDDDFERSLRQLGKKHDAVAVRVTDWTELELPKMGLVDFHDAETDQLVTIDTSDPVVRREYRENVLKKRDDQTKALRRSQVDVIEVDTGKDFIAPLAAYFKGRHR